MKAPPSLASVSEVWVTYLSPFMVVRVDEDQPFKIPLEQANAGNYDDRRLCAVVTALSLKPAQDAEVFVCLDGALAIARKGLFSSATVALEHFNYVLASLLIGGIGAEAVDRRDVVTGHVQNRESIWPVDMGASLNSHLHGLLRQRLASRFDNVRLVEPTNVLVSTLAAAYGQGQAVFQAVGNLTPTFLLRGFTDLQHHNWSDSLSALWVSVEQLTDYLWNHRFLADSARHPAKLKDRMGSLRQDNRTWSVAVRQEILWQVGILDEKTYSGLHPARKARNDLVHRGRSPDMATSLALALSTVSLLEIASNTMNLGIRSVIQAFEKATAHG